jgi:hypothetical protein
LETRFFLFPTCFLLFPTRFYLSPTGFFLHPFSSSLNPHWVRQGDFEGLGAWRGGKG